jgi:uncharacterized repeat protein (TIGR02543 family)
MYCNLKLSSSYADKLVIFAETAPGFFGATVDSTSSTRVETTGSSMQVVAVPTVTGRYVSRWTLYGSYSTEDYGLAVIKNAGGGSANYPAAMSSTASGADVIVIDEHGTHLGTPSGEGNYNNKSAVGVRHVSADDGWIFKGWRVHFSGSEGSSGGRMLSTGYVKSGDVYEFPADYAAAVVFKLGSLSSYPVTFEAVYEQDRPLCSLSYDSAGGSPTPEAQSAKAGDVIILAAAPQRDGYNFAGWLIGVNVYAAESAYTLSADATAIAQWTVDVVYSVTFDRSSADVTGPAIPSIVVAAGGAVILPDAALWRRDGYLFVGWAFEPGGTVSQDAGDAFIPSGDVTFFAVWAATSGDGARANEHTESTPGAWNTDISFSAAYHFRLSVNISEAVAVGYWTRNQSSIVRWERHYSPQNNPNPIVTETNVREQGPSVTGVCVVDGSGFDLGIPGDYLRYFKREIMYGSVGSQSKTHREELRRTSSASNWVWTAPELPNYDFDGWYTISQSWPFSVSGHVPTADEFTVKIGEIRTIPWSDILRRVNSVCVLNRSESYLNYEGTDRAYVNYVQLRYLGKRVQVLFDAAGGDLDDFYRFVRFTSVYGPLPIPVRPGWTFDGWFDSAGEEVTPRTVVAIAEDHILTARWTESADVYKLYFDAGRGGSPFVSKDVTEGLPVGELPVPVRPGWTFDGWFTLPVGGEEVTSMSIAGNSDAIVYAHWSGAAVTILFDAAGGICSESGRVVQAGSPVGVLPTPEMAGKKFAGWFVGDVELNSASVIIADCVAVARWDEELLPIVVVRYRIRFELGGGTLAAGYEAKYTRGYSKTLPTADEVSRDGFEFAGWFESADFAGEAVSVIPATATGTRTYFARWI